MCCLFQTDNKITNFVEIKLATDNDITKGNVTDALARNLGNRTIELVTYVSFPIGAYIQVSMLECDFIGKIVHSEPYIENLTILTTIVC